MDMGCHPDNTIGHGCHSDNKCHFYPIHKLIVSQEDNVSVGLDLSGHRLCSKRTYKVIRITRITFTFLTLPNNEVIWVCDCVEFISFKLIVMIDISQANQIQNNINILRKGYI